MKGIIKNYRRGRHTVNERQLVIEVDGIDSKAKAYSLVGSRVQWKSPFGTTFTGRITSAHGGNGAVRALFKKGMPGQCLGKGVEIIPRKKEPEAEKKKSTATVPKKK